VNHEVYNVRPRDGSTHDVPQVPETLEASHPQGAGGAGSRGFQAEGAPEEEGQEEGEAEVTGHVLVIGETQSGKTYYANVLHRRWPKLSIFFNTNEVPDVWGERITNHTQIREALRRGTTHFCYNPSQSQERAEAQLRALQAYLYEHAKPGTAPWCQLVVDEAQKFNEVAEDLTRLSLGRGIQVVVLTQYPTGLSPGLRSNCPNRVIFKPGIEGIKFLRDYGTYPHEEIVDHTQHRYRFAKYSPATGWEYHDPV